MMRTKKKRVIVKKKMTMRKRVKMKMMKWMMTTCWIVNFHKEISGSASRMTTTCSETILTMNRQHKGSKIVATLTMNMTMKWMRRMKKLKTRVKDAELSLEEVSKEQTIAETKTKYR